MKLQDMNIEQATVALHEATPFTQFSGALNVQYDASASQILGKDYWRVTEAFKFYVGSQEDDTWVYVPAGYLTDGATVPRLFWDLLPPWGKYGQAAVVHDMVCNTLQVYRKEQLTTITRAKADSIFKEAMAVAGVGSLTRNVMYVAVRCFAKLSGATTAHESVQKEQLEKNWHAVP